MTATPFRERIAFDSANGEISDESRRYMLMRPEALMGLFQRLDEGSRLKALDALKASVIEMGGDSARAYRAHGGGDPTALLATVAATAPDLGWGNWEFNRSKTRLELKVRNSPFATGYGVSPHPVCHAISGMATAVARAALGRDDIVAKEAACVACGAPSCMFEADL
ncbi:putative hydrocarbon binding protein [Mesorhizobium soli]|uniref:4-vinyl reductase n=1 Tax=Pseudaminobacter soli (ex Li et al. 2025) TaxID=1295366 RepID=UPI002474DEF8|nr:4-vinyl reductase [Mesorhizobium soli]MDH6233952.1 putative hydrocarbon binding protein [Mesorhizobium soli]